MTDGNKSLPNVTDEYGQPKEVEIVDDKEVDRMARRLLIKYKEAFKKLAK